MDFKKIDFWKKDGDEPPRSWRQEDFLKRHW
jgi:hypothetical protein